VELQRSLNNDIEESFNVVNGSDDEAHENDSWKEGSESHVAYSDHHDVSYTLNSFHLSLVYPRVNI
jgi:hypothetical protein